MIEMRRKWVDSSAEVYVVREIDDVIPERVGDGEAVQGIAPLRKAFLKIRVDTF